MKTTALPAAEIWNGQRIGGLHYRNALPLQRGLEQGAFLQGTPAENALAFAEGRLDLALLPVVAILQGGWESGLVPGSAIAADGPAYSVYVAWPEARDTSQLKVYRDPASRSSNVLYEVLRREVPTFGKRFGPLAGGAPAADEICARVLIGDPAVTFRHEHPQDHAFLDLAETWREHSGLPFVFARWVSRAPHPERWAEPLAALRDHNLATLEEWTDSWEEAGFWRTYLRGLSYTAGAREEEALRRFTTLAREYDLLRTA